MYILQAAFFELTMFFYGTLPSLQFQSSSIRSHDLEGLEYDDNAECDEEVPEDCGFLCHVSIMAERKKPCGKDGDKEGQKKVTMEVEHVTTIAKK